MMWRKKCDEVLFEGQVQQKQGVSALKQWIVSLIFVGATGCSASHLWPKTQEQSSLTVSYAELYGSLPVSAKPSAVVGVERVDINQLLTAGKAGEILLWDLSKSLAVGKVMATCKGPLESVAFHVSEGLVACGGIGQVEVLSVAGNEGPYTFTKATGKVLQMTFQPNGQGLLLSDGSGTLTLWKFRKAAVSDPTERREKTVQKYFGHNATVGALAFHPYGRVFFSGDWAGQLSAWLIYDEDLLSGRIERNLFQGGYFAEKASRTTSVVDPADEIVRIVPSPDGEYLLVGLVTGRLELWKVRGFKKVGEIKAHEGTLYDAQYISPDEVISSGRDGSIRKWKLIERPRDSDLQVDKENTLPTEGKDEDFTVRFTQAEEYPIKGIVRLLPRTEQQLIGLTQEGLPVHIELKK